MATHPIRFRLPTNYSTEIGRIIQRWAFLEWRMRSIAYLLLDLDPKRGRIAVREPRCTDYLIMIEDLIKLRSIKFNTKDKRHKNFKKKLVELQSFRNAIAHGVWLKHSATQKPVLQVVAGSYPPSPGKETVKARIEPQAVELDLENLKHIRTGIEAAITTMGRVKIELAKQLPS